MWNFSTGDLGICLINTWWKASLFCQFCDWNFLTGDLGIGSIDVWSKSTLFFYLDIVWNFWSLGLEFHWLILGANPLLFFSVLTLWELMSLKFVRLIAGQIPPLFQFGHCVKFIDKWAWNSFVWHLVGILRFFQYWHGEILTSEAGIWF